MDTRRFVVALTLFFSFSLLTFGAEPQASTARVSYHTPPEGAHAMMQQQHRYSLPSPLKLNNGKQVKSKAEWFRDRRPQLIRQWTRILGKLKPTEADQHWFGDIKATKVHDVEEREGYTRVHLSLPIEKDFLQPHLLLLPKDQGEGPFPAVIAWTSTSPDYTKPEEWWGAWLARRGFVVLTGWSFIRNYRGGIDYRQKVNEAVYERFGHWSPMAKMVHDVQREVEYLKTRPEVDGNRIGFIGFSLSAKAAVYVAAFAPEVSATVAIDPHIALHGDSNWNDPWYLDWQRKFVSIKTPDYPIVELRNTVWSALDANPRRPGFEHNHHELMALCAPRAFLLIGCSMNKRTARHSDDQQSRAYFNSAKEVYRLLGCEDRLGFATTDEGHRATSPRIDRAWQSFMVKWLRESPIGQSTSSQR